MGKIKIVDDIMGSGKSTWAINYINANTDKRFLCILPTLAECERYKYNTKIDIVDPEAWGTKWKHFKILVSRGSNIVTTHSLISKMDLETLELLKSKDYVLMIDECLDVLSPYKISKDDTKIIFNEGLVSLDADGFLVWNEAKSHYKGNFQEIQRLCGFRSLMGFRKKDSSEMARIIMWNFPVDFFKCFAESYIFTYLWDGSIQKTYFDIHNVEYEKFMLNDQKELIPHNEELEYKKRSEAAQLINIYEGKFNDIGSKIGKSNPLSKTWYQNHLRSEENKLLFEKIKRNTENYFRTETKTNSNDNMYTVFQSFEKYVRGKGYSKGFVSCNARGTNDFRNKKSLAYLVNFYIHPDIKAFAEHYNIRFDDEKFSLGALLQWIWRSQIRDGKPINIYIPSEHMRTLLKEWMYGKKMNSDAA